MALQVAIERGLIDKHEFDQISSSTNASFHEALAAARLSKQRKLRIARYITRRMEGMSHEEAKVNAWNYGARSAPWKLTHGKSEPIAQSKSPNQQAQPEDKLSKFAYEYYLHILKFSPEAAFLAAQKISEIETRSKFSPDFVRFRRAGISLEESIELHAIFRQPSKSAISAYLKLRKFGLSIQDAVATIKMSHSERNIDYYIALLQRELLSTPEAQKLIAHSPELVRIYEELRSAKLDHNEARRIAIEEKLDSSLIKTYILLRTSEKLNEKRALNVIRESYSDKSLQAYFKLKKTFGLNHGQAIELVRYSASSIKKYEKLRQGKETHDDAIRIVYDEEIPGEYIGHFLQLRKDFGLTISKAMYLVRERSNKESVNDYITLRKKYSITHKEAKELTTVGSDMAKDYMALRKTHISHKESYEVATVFQFPTNLYLLLRKNHKLSHSKIRDIVNTSKDIWTHQLTSRLHSMVEGSMFSIRSLWRNTQNTPMPSMNETFQKAVALYISHRFIKESSHEFAIERLKAELLQ